jgi:hypothetical protein
MSMSTTRYPRRAARVAALTLFAVTLTACDSAFQVTNPNQLGQSDLDRPEAAAALVNGAEATATRALGHLLFPLEAASDEFISIGGYDASRELDQGYLTNATNEFTTNSFGYLSEARFSADQAIGHLEGFDKAGALKTRSDLARAYLYGGIVYAAIGDGFADFVISDRQAAAPPIGEARMSQTYDTALVYLDRGLAVAKATGRADLQLSILAVRARTKHARALWTKLHPKGTAPADPLVADAGANADALAALALATQPDWKLKLTYGATTVPNELANWVNVRQEFRASDEIAVPTADNKKVASIRLRDPIDDKPDPVLQGILAEFVADPQYPPITLSSARELHLLIAESALSQGDVGEAARRINLVRALNGLTPYSGQVPLGTLLRYERRVNLFLQGRRLADQYRFGIVDPQWLPASDARKTPGTYLPIPDVERRSNCYLAGTC